MSELSDQQIDRCFPHQVILDAAYYSAHNFRLVLAFCVGLSLAPRGHAVLRVPRYRHGPGIAHAIERTRHGFRAGSDPRAEGGVMGW